MTLTLLPKFLSCCHLPTTKIGRKVVINIKKELAHFLEDIVRSIGVSNFEILHLEEIVQEGIRKPDVNQIELHPHFSRHSLRSYCEENGIFVQVSLQLFS